MVLFDSLLISSFDHAAACESLRCDKYSPVFLTSSSSQDVPSSLMHESQKYEYFIDRFPTGYGDKTNDNMSHSNLGCRDITQLERRLWTCAWTASGSWQTTALACKDSWCSMLLEVELAQAWDPFCWSACQLTTARSPSSASLSTHLLRSSLVTTSTATTPYSSVLYRYFMNITCMCTLPIVFRKGISHIP